MDIRVAAYAVITDSEDRILLAHWNQSGKSGWTLPGGGIDAGEDPVDAARREVLEETGLHAEIGKLIGVDSHVIPASQRLSADTTTALHALRIVYRAEVVGGTLTNEADGSTDQAAWFTRGEVANLHRVSLVDVGLTFAGIEKGPAHK